MPVKTLKAFLLPILISCNNGHSGNLPLQPQVVPKDTVKPHYNMVHDIPLPAGFTRTTSDRQSFSGWLRNISLKTSDTVFLFNGQPKQNQTAQYAVLDISVGDKDLQQCADAVMRLRAEYLYDQHDYQKIVFTDNENTVYQFKPPYTRANFDAYLQRVFGMCGSASLSKQLKPSTILAIKSGDVLIRGGFPGHAVIVMDVAENDAGQKIYLLAQSYMPAQDIHLLNNPMNETLSPWYEADSVRNIITPEYVFSVKELKQW